MKKYSFHLFSVVFQKILVLLLIVQMGVPAHLVHAQNRDEQSTEQSSAQITDQFQAIQQKNANDIYDVILGKKFSIRNDPTGVLNQSVYPISVSPKSIRRKQITTSYFPLERKTPDQTHLQGLELKYHGESFHEFYRPVKFAVNQGDYLFFIEEGSYLPDSKVQMISFIDLRYFSSAIGVTELPIFHIPLELGHEAKEISVQDGIFYVEDLPVGDVFVKFYSGIQQLTFNLLVNLVDPTTYESTTLAIDEFEDYFKKALLLQGEEFYEQMERAKQSRKSLDRIKPVILNILDQQKARGKGDPKSTQDSITKKYEEYFPHDQFEKTLGGISKNLKSQRRLFNRIELLWSRMTLPQPMGAPKIKSALLQLYSGFHKKGKAKQDAIQEGLLQLANSRAVQMTGVTVAALVAGYEYPEQLQYFLFEAMDLSISALEIFTGKLKALGEIGHLASSKSFGFSPANLTKAFISDGKLPKTLVAYTAIVSTVALALGVPHLIVNTVQLVKDLKSMNFAALREDKAWFEAFRLAFVQRQNRVDQEYYEMLGASRDEQLGQKSKRTYTAEENARVAEIRENSQIERDRWLNETWSGRFISVISRAKYFRWWSERPEREMQTFGEALRHFLFSASSVYRSAYASLSFSRPFNMALNYTLRPILGFQMLLYPNYFQSVTALRGMVKRATFWDGGDRSILAEANLRLSDPEFYRALRSWEDKILPAEAEIQKAAIRSAYRATTRFVERLDVIQSLYQGKPIDTLTDERLRELTYRERTYFRYYFEILFSRAMEKLVRDTLRQEANLAVDLIKDTRTLKQLSVYYSENIVVDARKAEELVSGLDQNPDVEFEARRFVEQSLYGLKAISLNLSHRHLNGLDPKKSTFVSAVQLVEAQKKKPQEVARAATSMVATLLVDKPLELAAMTLLLAGATDSQLIPIQEQMFSETSWFYAARYPYLNCFIVAAVSGALAEVWYRLQINSSNERYFQEVPDKKDTEKGFFNYFVKKAFADPKNSWWINQRKVIQYSLTYLRPATTFFMISHMIAFGHFDLDIYLVTYFTYLLLPFSGFSLKMEQGFELSTGFYASKYPEELRSHPDAQADIQSSIQKAKLGFNLFLRIIENVTTQVLSTLSFISTPEMGERAFSKVFLGGFTGRQVVLAALEKVSDYLGFIPGVEPATDLCARLLTGAPKPPEPHLPTK